MLRWPAKLPRGGVHFQERGDGAPEFARRTSSSDFFCTRRRSFCLPSVFVINCKQWSHTIAAIIDVVVLVSLTHAVGRHGRGAMIFMGL